MNGRYHKVMTLLSYIYLLRIPVVIGIILAALGPFAVWFSGKSILENLFVLLPNNIFWVMIVTLMLAWSLLVVSRVVLMNGKDRFGIDQWMTQDTLTGWHLLFASLPAFSLLVCAGVEKARALGSVAWSVWFASAFLGALIAYVAGFFGLVLSITVAPRYAHRPADQRFDIPPSRYSKPILRWAENFILIRLQDPNRFANWALRHIPEDLRSGYLDDNGHLYPGHWCSAPR